MTPPTNPNPDPAAPPTNSSATTSAPDAGAETRGRMAVLSAAFERYVLSAAFLFLAWQAWDQTQFSAFGALFSTKVWTSEVATSVGDNAQFFIMFLVQISIGGVLLLGRRPAKNPRNWRDIIIPLVVSFLVLIYPLNTHLPADWWVPWWKIPRRLYLLALPASWWQPWWQIPRWMYLVALTVAIIGPLFSLWSILTLGRSFGIFVAVRKVVRHGPYRWVRHPIYLGYIILWAAWLTVVATSALALLLTVEITLLLYRARLEENRLAEASPEYRAYRKQTGFIFPRFLGPAAPS